MIAVDDDVMNLIKKYYWLLFIVLAFLVRVSNVGVVFHKQGVGMCDPDGCYHLSVIKRIVGQYPAVPIFDPGLAYPYGARIPWPPLFDFTVATLALPFFKALGAVAGEKAAALIPPLLGSLAVLPIFLITRRWRSNALTAGALVFYCFMPKAVSPSMLCVLDHDAMIVILTMTLALTAIKTLEKGTRIGLAISAALLMHAWAASAIFLVPLGLAGLWSYFSETQKRNVHRVGEALILSSILYALGLALYLPVSQWQPSFVYPSLFQGYELLLTGVGLAILRGSRNKSLELGLAGIAATAGVLILPGMRDVLLQGVSFFAKHNPWLSTIAEYFPIIGGGVEPVRTEVAKIFIGTGLTLISLPVVLPLWLRKHREIPDRLAAAFMVILLLYSVNQLRYLMILSPWLAISGSWAVQMATARFSGRKKYLIAGLTVIIIIAPSLARVYAMPMIRGEAETGEMIKASRFLADYAKSQPAGPATSGSGVMAPWYFGHIIHYYSGLPVVNDGFGNTLPQNGLTDAARFFSAASDEEALAILRQRKVRYVVITQPAWEVLNDLKILQQDEKPYFEFITAPGSRREMNPHREFYKTIAARLVNRGSSGSGILPTRELVMIYPRTAPAAGSSLVDRTIYIYELRE